MIAGAETLTLTVSQKHIGLILHKSNITFSVNHYSLLIFYEHVNITEISVMEYIIYITMYVYPFFLQHCFSSELRHFFLNEYMVIASLAIRFGHWIPTAWLKSVKSSQQLSEKYSSVEAALNPCPQIPYSS